MDDRTITELSDKLDTTAKAELTKFLDEVNATSDPVVRNDKFTQLTDSCMQVLGEIPNRFP
jgi:hypothetical protein